MRFQLLVLAGLTFIGTAAAQISNETIQAYNVAMQAGDKDMIIPAAEALAREAVANPEHDIAQATAFEAAWMLCLVNACTNAAEAATFAAATPPDNEDAYPSAELRNVLASYVAWQENDSRGNRREMSAHLSELSADDISLVSITIHREHFLYYTQKGAWRDAERAAKAAADHSAAVKDEVFEDYALAALTGIAAAFNGGPKIEQYRDIQALRQEISAVRAELYNTSPDTTNAFLDKIGYRSDAWEGALQAYFNSEGRRRKVKQIQDEFDLDDTLVQEDTSDLCAGDFDGPPRIAYPSRALDRLQYGSIIVGFDLNNGKTENVQVLAAVPEGVFDDAAKRAVENLTWSPAEGIDPSSCSMKRENIIYPFVFAISP